MLISHFWYAFYFECAYKWPLFIKVATFPPMYLILVPNYEICKTKEIVKITYDKHFIYKTVKTITLEKTTNHLKHKLPGLYSNSKSSSNFLFVFDKANLLEKKSSSKKVFKDFANTLRVTPTGYFWKSIYCFTQKVVPLNMSEKICHKE